MFGRVAGHIRRQPVAFAALFVALFFGLGSTAAAASKFLTASDPITQGDLAGSTYGNPTIASGAVTNGKLANPSLTISAGTGLTGGGTIALGGSGSLSVDPTAVQNRVTGTCSTGTAISSIAQNGSVGCTAAGPRVVSALVNPDGTLFTVNSSPGATISVSFLSTGQYSLTATGLGTGCPLPALTSYGSSSVVSFAGGSCGNGTISTTVSTGSTDEFWVVTIVGVPATGAAPAQARSPLP